MSDGKILIVDDEVMIRDLLVDLLENVGDYELLTASNGREGLDICNQEKIDLVFTDLRMPVMEGMEMVSRLHKDQPDIPVVILTGYGRRDDVIEALRLGASNFLLKPQEVEMVRPIASKILRLKQKKRLEQKAFEHFVEGQLIYRIPNDMKLSLPVIDQITDIIVRIGVCDATEVMNIRLALDEAIVNAIVHGNLEMSSTDKGQSLDTLVDFNKQVEEKSRLTPYKNRKVEIRYSINQNEVNFEIEDEGKGFDWRSLPGEFTSTELLANHGRGLLLIRAFMSEVDFNNKGNCIKLKKRRDDKISDINISYNRT